jgi:eukaryotic-like serine/threonine-protein kinase
LGDETETLPLVTQRWLAMVTTRQLEPRATVAPPTVVQQRGLRALAVLHRLSGGSALEVGASIGEGGMSVVRLGRQVALGREVAVKTLREEERDEVSMLRLLREAWITGSLEHPNIVPVHDITVDASGNPQIILKRIAGAVWSDLMHDERLLRERLGVNDALDWNIRTLMQVCNAVHFAHSRGLLHRDLKSENVMIGEFGEVYVLDWGLAVALVDDGSGRLPLAREVDAIAGTPAYMAPEMLDGDGARLSVQTDVYLLGGILHEIVVGLPPHMGAVLASLLVSIKRSDPAVPEGTPVELAAILRRALAREPSARFDDALQLRLALGAFLEHRASIALASDALPTLEELEAACMAPPPTARGGEERRLRPYHLFGECRFAFREALRAWPENALARDGLRRAVVAMAELELAQGDARAAHLLLAEHDDVPPELVDRVMIAWRARREEEQRLVSLARDFDPRIGRRLRLRATAGLGVVWTALPWVGFFLERNDPNPTQIPPLLSSIATFVLAMYVALRARAAFSRTALNRSIVRSVGVVLAGQIALFAGTWWLGVSYEHTRVLVLMFYALGAGLAASAIERRLWPTALAYVAVAAIACVWPPVAWPVQSVANLVLTVNVIVIWRDPDDDVRPALARR